MRTLRIAGPGWNDGSIVLDGLYLRTRVTLDTKASALLPLHSPPRLSTLPSQLDNPNPHPALLWLDRHLALPLDSGSNIAVVVHVTPLLALHNTRIQIRAILLLLRRQRLRLRE
jgi:hypothetical protein